MVSAEWLLALSSERAAYRTTLDLASVRFFTEHRNRLHGMA